jgi:hypothetical protein
LCAFIGYDVSYPPVLFDLDVNNIICNIIKRLAAGVFSAAAADSIRKEEEEEEEEANGAAADVMAIST